VPRESPEVLWEQAERKVENRYWNLKPVQKRNGRTESFCEFARLCPYQVSIPSGIPDVLKAHERYMTDKR
jgi:hypothetical protein